MNNRIPMTAYLSKYPNSWPSTTFKLSKISSISVFRSSLLLRPKFSHPLIMRNIAQIWGVEDIISMRETWGSILRQILTMKLSSFEVYTTLAWPAIWTVCSKHSSLSATSENSSTNITACKAKKSNQNKRRMVLVLLFLISQEMTKLIGNQITKLFWKTLLALCVNSSMICKRRIDMWNEPTNCVTRLAIKNTNFSSSRMLANFNSTFTICLKKPSKAPNGRRRSSSCLLERWQMWSSAPILTSKVSERNFSPFYRFRFKDLLLWSKPWKNFLKLKI